MPGLIGASLRRRTNSVSERMSGISMRRTTIALEDDAAKQRDQAQLRPGDSAGGSATANMPAELLLHTSKPFVERCLAWLKKHPAFASNIAEQAGILKDGTTRSMQEPNWVLFHWTLACFGEEEPDEFKEEWALDDELQQVVDSASKEICFGINRKKPPPSAWEKYVKHAIITLFVPLYQLVIMASAFASLLQGKTFTKESLCVDFSGVQLEFAVLDFFINALLYTYAVLQMVVAGREWEGIRFITSLHYRPLANSAAFIAALFEVLTSMLFSACLYLIIVESPDIMSVLFNCTALSFVLELDNIVVSLFPRKAAQASLILAKKLHVEQATINDFALFLCAPNDEWAPYGLHRAQWAITRKWVRYTLQCATAFGYAIHLAGYYALTQCSTWFDPDVYDNATNVTTNVTSMLY